MSWRTNDRFVVRPGGTSACRRINLQVALARPCMDDITLLFDGGLTHPHPREESKVRFSHCFATEIITVLNTKKSHKIPEHAKL